MKPIEFILIAVSLSAMLFFAIKKSHNERETDNRLDSLEQRVNDLEPILKP